MALIWLSPAFAADASKIDKNANEALGNLLAQNTGAKALSDDAVAVLVFPEIIKAGLMIGGQHGDGALIKGGANTAYYKSVAASYGLQAGVQKFGYALFFMNQGALNYLDQSDG